MDKETFSNKYDQYSKEADDKFREQMVHNITDIYNAESKKVSNVFEEKQINDVSTAMAELYLINNDAAVDIAFAVEHFHEAKSKYILEKLFTE